MEIARGERGQGFLEYALVIVIVSLIVMVIVLLLGPAVGQMFSQVIPNI